MFYTLTQGDLYKFQLYLAVLDNTPPPPAPASYRASYIAAVRGLPC